MKKTEAAWLAGIIEGEGHLRAKNHQDRKLPELEVDVVMTDRDIVERVARLFGNTTVRQKNGIDPKYKEGWRTTAHGPRAMAVIKAIHPYMGTRRSERIEEMLEARKDLL